MPSIKTRNWMVTAHNIDFKFNITSVKFEGMRYQPEQGHGKEDSKPHLQCYVEFNEQIYASEVLDILQLPNPYDKTTPQPYSVWAHPRSGTREQAIEYCSSEAYCKTHHCGNYNDHYCNCDKSESKGRLGKPITIGKFKVQSKSERTDVTRMRLDVAAGMTYREFLVEYGRYASSHIQWVKELYIHFQPKRTWQTAVYWFYGETGTFKTTLARAIVNDPVYVKNPGTGKWFDGYCGEEVVILDEYRAEDIPWNVLLSLTGCLQHRVEIKGGMMEFVAKVIIITCPMSHEVALKPYETINDKLEQMTRRIRRQIEFPLTREESELLLQDMRLRLQLLRDPDEHNKHLYSTWSVTSGVAPPGITFGEYDTTKKMKINR